MDQALKYTPRTGLLNADAKLDDDRTPSASSPPSRFVVHAIHFAFDHIRDDDRYKPNDHEMPSRNAMQATLWGVDSNDVSGQLIRACADTGEAVDLQLKVLSTFHSQRGIFLATYEDTDSPDEASELGLDSPAATAGDVVELACGRGLKGDSGTESPLISIVMVEQRWKNQVRKEIQSGDRSSARPSSTVPLFFAGLLFRAAHQMKQKPL